MAMPRFDGGTSFTTSPSILSSPEVISSSPAIDRSKVDLPQPEGPTKTMNSPDFDVEVDAVENVADCRMISSLALA